MTAEAAMAHGAFDDFMIMVAVTRTMMMWCVKNEFSSEFFLCCVYSLSHQLSLKSKTLFIIV